MSRSWTNTNIKKELWAQESGMVLPILIQVYHASWNSGTPLYLVNNTQSITYNGNTYLPFPFTLDPPDETDSGITNAQLTISAVDQQIVDLVRSVDSAPTVTAVALYYYETVEPLVSWTFKFKDITISDDTVTGTLVYEDRLSNQLSPISVTAQTFPGLF